MAEESEKQKEAQEKVLIYQILQNQLEELTKQAGALEAKVSELDITHNALKDIEHIEAGADALIPMGAGCFAYGKLAEKDRFLVEIGAGILADKTLVEASAIVEGKKEEIMGIRSKLQEEMHKLSGSINLILLDLQSMSEKEKQQGRQAASKKPSDDDSIEVD